MAQNYKEQIKQLVETMPKGQWIPLKHLAQNIKWAGDHIRPIELAAHFKQYKKLLERKVIRHGKTLGHAPVTTMYRRKP